MTGNSTEGNGDNGVEIPTIGNEFARDPIMCFADHRSPSDAARAKQKFFERYFARGSAAAGSAGEGKGEELSREGDEGGEGDE
jgi:hypothetical protein